jgi:hypothetical protein
MTSICQVEMEYRVIRLKRICMGKFQKKKLTRDVVLKDAETYSELILSASAPNVENRAKISKFFSILTICSKVQVQKLKFCTCLTRLIKVNKINRKFRVPRKQGAHFLGARAQIQDSWVISSSS